MAETIEEAFMEDIIADPDDDAPRLIYADWLDDHGQEARAEFIRVQIELDRIGEDDERSDSLWQREQVLLARHQKEWLENLGERLDEKELAGFGFSRGFLDHVSLAPEFAGHPGIRGHERCERLNR